MKLCRMIYHYSSWIKGSYALEAAFVVPVILGMIFSLMYALFFGHDKLVAYGNLRKGILECAVDGEDVLDQDEWKKQIQNHLWMGRVEEGGISRNGDEVTGKVKITWNLSIPVLQLFLEDKQEINCEETWNTQNPAEAVRWKGKEHT